MEGSAEPVTTPTDSLTNRLTLYTKIWTEIHGAEYLLSFTQSWVDTVSGINY